MLWSLDPETENGCQLMGNFFKSQGYLSFRSVTYGFDKLCHCCVRC